MLETHVFSKAWNRTATVRAPARIQAGTAGRGWAPAWASMNVKPIREAKQGPCYTIRPHRKENVSEMKIAKYYARAALRWLIRCCHLYFIALYKPPSLTERYSTTWLKLIYSHIMLNYWTSAFSNQADWDCRGERTNKAPDGIHIFQVASSHGTISLFETLQFTFILVSNLTKDKFLLMFSHSAWK